ncbi:MAG: ABC transporter ATP-binding protein [Ramlibacter sp.]
MRYVTAGGARIAKAVTGVSFELGAGETLGIVGESGSGKSTLVLSLLQLLAPGAQVTEGEVIFEGRDLRKLSAEEMTHVRGKRMAMILQDPMASLNPLFTVGEQVAEPLRLHESMTRAAAKARAVELLSDVRIPAASERAKQYPHEMSGGMRQRIVGAIGISCEPSLLIADEPTTSLDLTIQAQYLDLLRSIQRERGLAMILITHNLGIVARMCDTVAIMYGGRIVERGPVRDIFDRPAHPYTQALLESMPRRTARHARLKTIEGQPPDPAALPAGCSFHPRCPQAMPVCTTEFPPEVRMGDRHVAKCWLRVANREAAESPA